MIFFSLIEILIEQALKEDLYSGKAVYKCCHLAKK